ncbi:Armadillo-type fold [Pseudocohnilembus persalinus]|uniref:Armadillo-type fold n=1 Tax=Pseudocohnilembus persalinus TaxID=266149 RepID=A0A0V0QKM6_PSEPJ|nr:Armadillo-type fold [Pseudocohnilembus persalinus]|eukprot:KRX02740.1 Armadillo-type fold [Pseudocohnilembus persalinus]
MENNRIVYTSQLNKALVYLLSVFEKNKEWADISQWLNKVEQALNDYPSPLIKDKLQLAKRLAQCLNPLLPNAIHSTTIHIYALLFKSMKLLAGKDLEEYSRLFNQDIGIYAVGLFPFYQNASTRVKDQFLDLVNDYMVPLDREIIPCLPGLLLCLVPGLEDNNEGLIKKLNLTMQNLFQAAGRRYFIGSLWMTIKRTNRGRAAAIKLLSKFIPKCEEIIREESMLKRQSTTLMSSKQGEDSKLQEIGLNIESQSDKIAQQQQIDEQIENLEQISQELKIDENKEEENNDQQEQQENESNEEQQEQDQDKNQKENQENQQDNDEQIQDENKDKKDENSQEQEQQSEEQDKQSQQNEQLQQEKQDNQEQEQNEQEQEQEQLQQQQANSNVQNNQDKKQEQQEQWQDFGNEMKQEQVQQNLQNSPQKMQQQQEENRIIKPQFRVIEQGINENIDTVNFPNKSTLVINAIIECLEDETPLVRRTILDFLIQHLSIKSNFLSDTDRMILIQALLYQMQKKDASMIKRVNTWLFGKADDDNRYNVSQEYEFVIPLLKQAFKKVFEFVPTSQENCTMPIKILQNFYMEHENLVDLTLKDISIDLGLYIYKYNEGYEFSQDIKKFGKRFLQSIPQQIQVFLNSLAEEVVFEIQEQNDDKCQEVIDLIRFTFDNLLKMENFGGETAVKSVKHTISGIFKSLSTLKIEEMDKFQFLQPCLNLIQRLVEKLEVYLQKLESEENDKFIKQDENGGNKEDENQKKQKKIEDSKLFDQAIEDFSLFFQNFTKSLGEVASKQKLKQFKSCSLILVRIQKFIYAKQNITQLPDWFKSITYLISKMKNPKISLIAIEAMIEILISEKKDKIYEILKQLILEESHAVQQKDTLISGSDYTKVTLEKLWSLLDFSFYHEQIIDLILNFSQFFPQFFKEVVINSFTILSIAEQQLAMRRFASFWKLTQHNYQKQKLLFELNKVGLFMMLDFLDHDNPLLRNASKNWLEDSSNQLYRIIDPLFEVLLIPNSNVYTTDYGQLIYTKLYDTKQVQDTFRKLKSILVNANDMFSKFICNTELSTPIQEYQKSFTSQTESFLFRNLSEGTQISVQNGGFQLVGEKKSSGKQQQQAKKMTYLDLLVLICLKYIQGSALESMGIKFYVENGAVNASSCEFLEYLISHFEEPQFSMRLCQYILDPLMKVFNHVVLNQEYVMQIQLLNLFKDQVQKQLIFSPVLSSKLFIPNILRGLNTDISYIKQQFVDFISMLLNLMCQNLFHPVLTNQIQSILYCYATLIRLYSKGPAERQQQNQVQQENQIEIQAEQGDEDFHNSFEISIILQGVTDILNYFLKIDQVNKDESIMLLHNRSHSSVMGSVASVLSLGLYSKTEQKDKIEYNFDRYKETCVCILYDIQKVLEMFIFSWYPSSEFKKVAQNFSRMGTTIYQFQQFNQFNQKLSVMIDQIKSKPGKVKGQIINSFSSLLYQYPLITMNCILKLWNQECFKEVPQFDTPFVKTQLMGNLIEILIVADLDTEFFLETLIQSDYMFRIYQGYQKKHPKEKKNIFVLNVEQAFEEARLLYFMYVYFSYKFIDGKALKKENLLTFWLQILKILKILALSKNPSTGLWIIEFIYMLSRKYSPKEILNETSFKKSLHELLSDKFLFLSNVAAQTYTFIFNQDPQDILNEQQKKKKDNNNKNQQQPTQQTITLSKYTVIAPFSPTVYEMALDYQMKIFKIDSINQGKQKKNKRILDLIQQNGKENEKTDDIMVHMFANAQTTETDEIYQKYRLYILKTIKNISLDLLQNTYAPERSDRIVSRTKEYMEPLFTIIEDKSDKNQMFLQAASEVLHSLLSKAPNLMLKEFKKGILDIFNKDNFFNQSKQTMKYWSKIIDQVLSCDKLNDQFTEYLSKLTLTGSFFSKESTINNTRIKSFKRVCFIIFSGTQDQYSNKLKALLDKISEVIKNAEQVHPSLLILILFCIRILILRLSNANLKELFKQIWPMLITILIQIYGSASEVRPEHKNPNLLLAGLKLIEILSISQFDEFQLHQWIFVFDYFGLQVSSLEEIQEQLQKLSPEYEKSNQKQNNSRNEPKKQKMTPFSFQPYLTNSLPNQEYFQYVNQSFQDEIKQSYESKNRRIIMSQSKVHDEIQLKYQAWQLCLYLISCNEQRLKIDPQLIEDLIEEDFIQLDEHVLKP